MPWTINTCPTCGALLDRRQGVGGWWCREHGEAIPPIAVEVDRVPERDAS